MRQAICVAVEGVRARHGGPFGCVIVRQGKVLAQGCNTVTSTNDPTAHAEVNAIRAACAALGRFQLEDCELYTSCEPCPMCLGAIYWARLPVVYFGGTRVDAAAAGFDDDFIYREVPLAPEARSVRMIPLLRDEAAASFDAWTRQTDRQRY